MDDEWYDTNGHCIQCTATAEHRDHEHDCPVAKIERLTEALRIYADPDKWDPDRHLGMGNHGRSIDTVEWRVAAAALEDTDEV